MRAGQCIATSVDPQCSTACQQLAIQQARQPVGQIVPPASPPVGAKSIDVADLPGVSRSQVVDRPCDMAHLLALHSRFPAAVHRLPTFPLAFSHVPSPAAD